MNTVKMVIILLMPMVVACSTQIRNMKTETVEINGNCNMCKNTIELAGSAENQAKVLWNPDSKRAEISFDSLVSSRSEILKKIALAGYDNQEFLAPDEAYAKLPECCQYERVKKVAVEEVIQPILKDTLVLDTPKEEPKESGPSILVRLFDEYFQLKDALIASSNKQAASSAGRLHTMISKIDIHELSDEERRIFVEIKTALLFETDHIEESESLEHQRDHFSNLSEKLYKVAKVTSFAETIYYQNCPMYADGKGANWLSRDEKVKNPYYGAMMLTCGKTVETIK